MVKIMWFLYSGINKPVSFKPLSNVLSVSIWKTISWVLLSIRNAFLNTLIIILQSLIYISGWMRTSTKIKTCGFFSLLVFFVYLQYDYQKIIFNHCDPPKKIFYEDFNFFVADWKLILEFRILLVDINVSG